MARVRCNRCGDEIEEGTRPCAYCNVPRSRVGDADPSPGLRLPLQLAKVFAVSFIILIMLTLFSMVMWERARQSYRVKATLSKVVSVLDPVETAITQARKGKGKLPQVTIVVTAANQGQIATGDWAALGFDALPALSREIQTLRITPEGDIVVTLVNIKDGIDNTELRARAAQREPGGWLYECASGNDLLKKYFHC